VVLLDQDRVVETGAVVLSPARHHGLLLEDAQARRGLAGVEDPGAGALDRANEPGGEGGDARQVSEEVERDALGGEDRAPRAGDLGHQAARPPGSLRDVRVPAQ
jgi:hypothetical protein